MTASRVPALVAAGLLAAASAHGLAQKPKDPPPPVPSEVELMAVKLKRAQSLVEALAKEDYKTLEASADALATISKTAWFLRAHKTDEYDFQSRVFQKSAAALAEKARAKNLDGAALAYLDMTRSCVACHSHIRGRKRD